MDVFYFYSHGIGLTFPHYLSKFCSSLLPWPNKFTDFLSSCYGRL